MKALNKIKSDMKAYRDFFGGELLDFAEIDNIKTIEDADKIIENHRSHMEDILSDAKANLDRFKKELWK